MGCANDFVGALVGFLVGGYYLFGMFFLMMK